MSTAYSTKCVAHGTVVRFDDGGFDIFRAPFPVERARRLAACWNACENVPIEVLEAHASGGLPWSVADQIDQRVMHANVVQRNHELLLALRVAKDVVVRAGAAKLADGTYFDKDCSATLALCMIDGAINKAGGAA